MTFRPGQSGNPRGRRPGTVTKAGKLRAEIEAQIPEILEALVAAALDGDVPAAKLLLDRALPPLRPESRPLPTGIPSDPREIPQAVADGKLTAEQGAALLDLAGKVAAIEGLEDLQDRLAKLESLLAQPND